MCSRSQYVKLNVLFVIVSNLSCAVVFNACSVTILKGYSPSHGEISVDIRLNVN